ncbi:radical SAM protein [Halobacteriovorax sp. ZH5_bin.2]|uniref:radical SAM protein n=1 Tax=unclassified Halobacteriovorax TaxID=2639665 RepID=UPI003715D914
MVAYNFENPAKASQKRVAKKYFTLEITTSALCDLNCTYCFEGEKVDKARLDNELPVIFKRIDSILADKNWFQSKYDGLNISLWGGEPTLNPNFIIELMNKYRDHENVDFHLYTNAFNIHNMRKIIENVDTSKLHVQVSYDGRAVNDSYRLMKNKKPSSNHVINNLYELAGLGINVSMKATLPIDSMESLYSCWEDYYDIQKLLWKVSKDINISYSPTIDYITKFSLDEKKDAIKIFRAEFLKIAKREIEFYNENGRYLCSWFGGEDNRKHCSAGYNMAAIDQRGNLYACHGAIYSKHKEELAYSDINDDAFVEKISAYTQKFEEPLKKIHKDCQDCVATTCMICPVASHEKSEKTDFFEKWTDNWVNELCGFFKTFGEIDRAVQKHIFSANAMTREEYMDKEVTNGM